MPLRPITFRVGPLRELGDWGATLTPDDTLQKSTVYVLPNATSVSGTTPIDIFTRNNSSGYIVQFRKATSASARAMSGMQRGTAKKAHYLPVVATSTTATATRINALGLWYYQISTGSVSYAYSGSFAADGIEVNVLENVANSGIGEIVRNRGGSLTVLGELDFSLGTSTNRAIHTTLSDTIVSGDTLTIRRKSGQTKPIRVGAVALYSTTDVITSSDPLVIIDRVKITDEDSSIEWAYRVGAFGGTTEFVGNIAHQSPFTEVSGTEAWYLDGILTAMPTLGVTHATVSIDRTANIDLGSGNIIGGYAMTTKMTVSGIRCDHSFTFAQRAAVGNLYTAMLMHLEAETLNVSGTEYDVSVDDNTFVQLGNASQVQIHGTLMDKFMCMVNDNVEECEYLKQSGKKKLYMDRIIASPSDVPSGTNITGGWSLMMGLER